LRRLIAPDPTLGVDAADAVARDIHARRLQRGERPVGRKIGFTNRSTWLEHQAPFGSYVYDSTVHVADGRHAQHAVGALLQPRIEPEIQLHFAATPPVTDDEEAILACIDWVAQGFELVQSPYPDWTFGTADAIAAFGLHGALVVGTPVPVSEIEDCAARLRTFTIELSCNGRPRAVGGGADVLDSPLLAFAHLNRTLTEPVQAGEIVSTGTLTEALPAKAGETWTTTLAGIDLPGLSLRLA
jgi:2-oxo-3-hexenedioate decarboxylase